MHICSKFCHTRKHFKMSTEPDNADFINEKWPTKVLENVFSHLPPTDMIKTCSLVCRGWSEIVRNQQFWRKLCIQSGVAIPPPSLRADHEFDYQRLRVLQPLGRNLVVNGSGENGTFEPWNDWEGIIIESLPVGCLNTATSTCFASHSLMQTMRRQFHKLVDLGITTSLIKHGRLRVTFSEQYATRLGSSGRYTFMGCLTLQPINGPMSEGRVISFSTASPVWQSDKVAFNIPANYPETGYLDICTQAIGHPGQPEGVYDAKTSNATMTVTCDAWADPIGDDVRNEYWMDQWDSRN